MSVANIARSTTFLTKLLHAGVFQDGTTFGIGYEKADHKQFGKNWLGPCPGIQ